MLHIVKNVGEMASRESAQQSLEQAARELADGCSFSDVADRYSDCAGNGGDLGWILRGEMVDEFEDVVFEMAPGAVSPILRLPLAYTSPS